MKNIDLLRRFAHHQPFSPFQIHLENGDSYNVAHPDYVIIDEDIIVVYLKSPPYAVWFNPRKMTAVKQLIVNHRTPTRS